MVLVLTNLITVDHQMQFSQLNYHTKFKKLEFPVFYFLFQKT